MLGNYFPPSKTTTARSRRVWLSLAGLTLKKRASEERIKFSCFAQHSLAEKGLSSGLGEAAGPWEEQSQDNQP